MEPFSARRWRSGLGGSTHTVGELGDPSHPLAYAAHPLKCALRLDPVVAVPPMLVYLRLELDQIRIREGQGMSPLTAPAIAQVPEAGYRE